MEICLFVFVVIENYLRLKAKMSPSFDISLANMAQGEEDKFDDALKEHIGKWFDVLPFITSGASSTTSQSVTANCNGMKLYAYYYNPGEPNILLIQQPFPSHLEVLPSGWEQIAGRVLRRE